MTQVTFNDPVYGPLTAVETTPGNLSTVELLNAAGQVVSTEPNFDGAPPPVQGYIITPSDGAFFLDGTYIGQGNVSTTDTVLSELNQAYLTYGAGTPADENAISFYESGFVGHTVQALTFNAQGLLIEPSPTTSDYTQSQLATLLANVVSSANLTTILNQHPNGAVVETDTDGP
jgi:hypothetical protein